METKRKYERALRVAAQPGRNPGVPLDLDWIRAVRVNRSAVERRAATIPTRRTVKKEWQAAWLLRAVTCVDLTTLQGDDRSEEHTSELQSRLHLVCRLLLEKKKKNKLQHNHASSTQDDLQYGNFEQ